MERRFYGGIDLSRDGLITVEGAYENGVVGFQAFPATGSTSARSV